MGTIDMAAGVYLLPFLFLIAITQVYLAALSYGVKQQHSTMKRGMSKNFKPQLIGSLYYTSTTPFLMKQSMVLMVNVIGLPHLTTSIDNLLESITVIPPSVSSMELNQCLQMDAQSCRDNFESVLSTIFSQANDVVDKINVLKTHFTDVKGAIARMHEYNTGVRNPAAKRYVRKVKEGAQCNQQSAFVAFRRSGRHPQPRLPGWHSVTKLTG